MTITSRSVACFSILLLSLCAPARAQDLMRDMDTRSVEFQAVLGFEGSTSDKPPFPWKAQEPPMADSISLDREIKRSGEASARLSIEGGAAIFGLSIPVDFTGSQLEIRAFVRAEDVFAGALVTGPLSLSAIPDGSRIRGTHDWMEYRRTVTIQPTMHQLPVVTLMIGGPQGTIWIDDVEILVDGNPIGELDKIEVSPSDQEREMLIALAESAAYPRITQDATIKTVYGLNVLTLREGSNQWTCWAETVGLGAMCNEPDWNEWLMGFWLDDPTFSIDRLSTSYMLAGIGEDPHVMLLVPEERMLEGLPINFGPIWAMWAGTPYAHIMLYTGEESAP